MIKKLNRLLLSYFILGLCAFSALAVNRSDDKVWREIDDSNLQQRTAERFANPEVYKTFRLDKNLLQVILRSAPQEFLTIGQNSDAILTIPMPDGSFQRFAIKDSPIMEPALAAKFPEIKTYLGQGIDDPTATIRFDITPNGFRAMILSKDGTIYIEPYSKGDTLNYISFNKADLGNDGERFVCEVGAKDTTLDFSDSGRKTYLDTPNVVINGTMLRTYRLAVAATGEYTAAVGGGTVAGAMAAIVTTMNRVNGIYGRDLAVRMNLVANNNAIIYTNAATDPYTNNNGQTLLNENQTNIDTVIGTANYDIGHVFSTGGGGIAFIGSPCNAQDKAKGVTGSPNPQGDPFDVDYVSHEMGHQFGGTHTFNGTAQSCGGAREETAAFEPASGSTIQAYGGICAPQNLQRNTNDYFNIVSLEQMVTYIQGGGACSVNTANGNTPPTVSVTGGTTFNIPRNTPFALTASGSDVNGDNLTYDWEEYDLGPAGLPNTNNLGPIFRSYSPTISPIRTFPSLTYILNNANSPAATYTGTSATGLVCAPGDTCITGEVLPSIARTMSFQVTARDNRAGGGAVNSTTAQVVVNAASGPFVVAVPNTNVSWAGNSQQTVTWNVANTTAAPISAANVQILLSTDGGQTFPTVLLPSTPNDGTEAVTIPNTPSTNARIKVQAVGNIFFDISDANFTITQGTATVGRTAFDFDGDRKADISVFRPDNGTWYLQQSQNGFTGVQFGTASDKIVPADFDGDGKTDVAVFRSGTWYLQRSTAGFFGIQFGTATDIPVPADFDGDGRADLAVYRPSNGGWYIYNLATNQTSSVQFGTNEDKPVPTDYDGDGKTDVAVFRPSTGTWYLQRSQLGFTGISFGDSADKPVPADFDGDGRADLAVFRPSNGTWYLQRSTAGFTGVQFGLGTDSPVPADYDGDGKTDVAVFRSGAWYLNRSTQGFTGVNFGVTTDRPAPNAFVF